MPRNPSGVYSQPYPDVVGGTPIESLVYNGFVNDVETDLNTPRPIVAGGTGATTADAALTNLGGEKAKQVVTNFDTHVFRPGSFYALGGATAAPTANVVYGFVTDYSASHITLEGYDALTGKRYTRQRTGGAWAAWREQESDQLALDNLYVNRTGDSMTGQLAITNAAKDECLEVLSTLPDDSTANYGFASIKANVNGGAYPTAANSMPSTLRASVAGVGTFQHSGSVSYYTTGIYGWVPTGGHGNWAMAGLFDRPDGNGHPGATGYSVTLCGAYNPHIAHAIGVYGWAEGAYNFFVHGDGYIYGAADATIAGTVFATTVTATGTVSGAAVTASGAVTGAVFNDAGGDITEYIPVSSKAGAYTTVAADAGTCIIDNSGLVTIAGTLYDVGTVITIAAFGGSITIANTQTMYLAGSVLTGTRTLTNVGIATAIKVTSTSWIISGAGLT